MYRGSDPHDIVREIARGIIYIYIYRVYLIVSLDKSNPSLSFPLQRVSQLCYGVKRFSHHQQMRCVFHHAKRPNPMHSNALRGLYHIFLLVESICYICLMIKVPNLHFPHLALGTALWGTSWTKLGIVGPNQTPIQIRSLLFFASGKPHGWWTQWIKQYFSEPPRISLWISYVSIGWFITLGWKSRHLRQKDGKSWAAQPAPLDTLSILSILEYGDIHLQDITICPYSALVHYHDFSWLPSRPQILVVKSRF